MKYKNCGMSIYENGYVMSTEYIIEKLSKINYLEKFNTYLQLLANMLTAKNATQEPAPPSELSILRTKLWADAFICEMPNTDSEDWQNECANIADLAVAEFDKRFKI